MAFKKSVLGLSVGVAAALLAACASQPAAQPAQPAAQAATSPAAQASGAATNPAQSTEADTASAMEKKFQETARSYKTVQKDGKTMYCKREKVIGSTIPTMQCYTETQLRNQIEATEELKKRMRRGGGPCVQTGGCQGG
jgi:hypothetical protein